MEPKDPYAFILGPCETAVSHAHCTALLPDPNLSGNVHPHPLAGLIPPESLDKYLCPKPQDALLRHPCTESFKRQIAIDYQNPACEESHNRINNNFGSLPPYDNITPICVQLYEDSLPLDEEYGNNNGEEDAAAVFVVNPFENVPTSEEEEDKGGMEMKQPFKKPPSHPKGKHRHAKSSSRPFTRSQAVQATTTAGVCSQSF